MSESLSKRRAYPGAAPEPRIDPPMTNYGDPLAELARLVGRDDPFRDIFPARARAAEAKQTEAEPEDRDHTATDAVPDFGFMDDHPETAYARPDHDEPMASPEAYEPIVSSSDPHGYDAPISEPRDLDEHPFPASQSRALTTADHPFDLPAMDAAAPPVSADLWAEGVAQSDAEGPADFQPPPEAAEQGPSKRRTIVVLAAVVALTAGGLGATFLVRGHPTNSAAAVGTAPTIMADKDPVKVQPPETSNPSTGGDGTTGLIEKSASDNVANAKVVNAQERPIDLAQLPKAPAAAEASVAEAPPAGTTSPSPFPEPRKVKTIIVRADGSVVGEAPSAPAPAAPIAPAAAAPAADSAGSSVGMQIASMQADAAPPPAPTPAPVKTDAAPVPKSATPKSTARATATPKVVPKPKPKPVETAAVEDPAPAPATTSSGAYSVQLAAPPTEQDAKDTSSRLQKKFADQLAGRRPSIHKADSGNKSVYRVRVSNLSQDDAKELCTKLQSSGGSCFVVHN